MNSDIPGQPGPSVDPVVPGATAPAYSPAPPPYPAPRGSSRPGWLIPALVLVAFGGGIGATLWGMPKIETWWKGDVSTEAVSDGNSTQALLDGKPDSTRPPRPALPLDTDPLSVTALETRLVTVSARIDAISGQASTAASNAARAEGLLIAFATRRALDRGAPLGYLEGELRLRFGDSQPRAVATIINASHAPVTIGDLQAELEEVGPALIGTGEGKSDWWTATRRELANLIIIRKADAPSPVPQQVIERAKLMISSERVNAALQEIERLPNHEKADSWIQMARKYNEARRALDVIEAAAILEPRSIPAGTRTEGSAAQVAPPPPLPQEERPQGSGATIGRPGGGTGSTAP